MHRPEKRESSLKAMSKVSAQGNCSHTHSTTSDLPLLQVFHIGALEGGFQEVGELIVNRVTAFQMPRRAVICGLGRGTEREPLSQSLKQGVTQQEEVASSPSQSLLFKGTLLQFSDQAPCNSL